MKNNMVWNIQKKHEYSFQFFYLSVVPFDDCAIHQTDKKMLKERKKNRSTTLRA